MRSHFRLIIAVLVSMIFSQAQLFAQALDAFYFGHKSIYIKSEQGENIGYNSKMLHQVDSSGKINYRLIDTEEHYKLKSGDSIVIAEYENSLPLFQQFAANSGQLIHQGYLKPVLTPFRIDTTLFRPAAGVDSLILFCSYEVNKTGAWYHRLDANTQEVGNYSNNKKHGIWLEVNRSVPLFPLNSRTEYVDGKIISSKKINKNEDVSANKNLLMGKWHLYFRLPDPDKEKDEFYIVVTREMKDVPRCRYGGEIEFVDAEHLYFRQYFPEPMGVNYDKEYRLREWKIEDKNILLFNDFKWKFNYLSEDIMMLTTL